MQTNKGKRKSSAATKLTKSQLLTELNKLKKKLRKVKDQEEAESIQYEFRLLAAADQISSDGVINHASMHRQNMIQVMIAALMSEDLFPDHPMIDHSEIISCLKIWQVVEVVR